MDREELLAALRRERRRRERALATDADARTNIARLARKGLDTRLVRKTEIHEAAGISRPSLDDMLKR